MNSDDTLYGRIRNGVLILSGSSPSIRVDGGCLVVADGPVPVPASHRGRALPANQRMVTLRLPRAGCELDRIAATRNSGFITLGAIKWMHDVGVSFIQIDWNGEVLLETAPARLDRPVLRRAQALSQDRLAITREIIRRKLLGQAKVATLLGAPDTATLIEGIASELSAAHKAAQVLAAEAVAATAYWSVWSGVALRFERRSEVPLHWQTFGGRNSPLTAGPFRAVTPGQALLNYLSALATTEATIALAAVGLDPGIGVFHVDRDRRASLAYDAVEVIRPYVEAFVLHWIAECRLAKRDFWEHGDGHVTITHPAQLAFGDDAANVAKGDGSRCRLVGAMLRGACFPVFCTRTAFAASSLPGARSSLSHRAHRHATVLPRVRQRACPEAAQVLLE